MSVVWGGQVLPLIIDNISIKISHFGAGWLPLVAWGLSTRRVDGDVTLDAGGVDVVGVESPLGELRSWPSLILMANSARLLASGIRPSEEREDTEAMKTSRVDGTPTSQVTPVIMGYIQLTLYFQWQGHSQDQSRQSHLVPRVQLMNLFYCFVAIFEHIPHTWLFCSSLSLCT